MYCVFAERKTETTGFVFSLKLGSFETQSHIHTVLCMTLYDIPFNKCSLMGNNKINDTLFRIHYSI